jgi:hypothetical protein
VLLTLVGLNLSEVYGVRSCRCGPNGVDTISVNEHTDYEVVTSDVGGEFGWAHDPIFGTPFPRHRVQGRAIGRAIESTEKGGEKHIQFKPPRIDSISNTW